MTLAAQRSMILLVILLSPTDVFLRVAGVSLADFTVLLMFGGFGGWLLLGGRLRDPGQQWLRFLLAAMALLLALMIGAVLSPHVVASLRGTASYAILSGFAILMALTVRREEHLVPVLRMVIAVAAIVAVLAWLDALGVIDTSFANPKRRYSRTIASLVLPFERSGGIVSNYSVYGALLLMAFPLAWCVAQTRWVAIMPRWLANVAMSVVGLGLLATQSRSTIMAGVVVVTTLLWRNGLHNPGGILRAVVRTGSRLLVIFAVAIVLRYANQMATLLRAMAESGATSRLAQYAESLLIWREHPLFGIGGGAFTEYAEMSTHLHNILLNVLVSSGLFGFSAFVAVNLLAALSLWRLIRAPRARFRVLGDALLAGFLGVGVELMFASGLTVFHYWLLLGLIIAADAVAGRRAEGTTPAGRPPFHLTPSPVSAWGIGP